MKLIATNPADNEQAHIAEVVEEILGPAFDVISAEGKSATEGAAVVEGIDNVLTRRDNRVA